MDLRGQPFLLISPFRRRHAKPAFKGQGEGARFAVAQLVSQLAYGQCGLFQLLSSNGLSDPINQMPEGGTPGPEPSLQSLLAE